MNNCLIALKSRPIGWPGPEHFELIQGPIPKPQQDEILVRNLLMSVDPYMRGRMREGKSYVPPFALGQPLEGDAIGVVVESRSPLYKPGDHVASRFGWRDYYTVRADLPPPAGPRPVDLALAPAGAHLGILGMPGMTAYVGLKRIAQLKAGETLFVSAAAGAVGSVVCQIGRQLGARVIGCAGSAAKLAYLQEELHVDGAFDYKTEPPQAALERLCPDGIDVYFDNVGGTILEAAIGAMRDFGRCALCGMISAYNAEELPPGPRNLFLAVARRLRLQGFIVLDHQDMAREFYTTMSTWLHEGAVSQRETIVHGLANAPQAFIDMMQGANIGKMLVQLDNQ